MVLEKLLESPLDCKEIKPIHPKGNAEAETPVLWPPDVKNWLTGKDPDAGTDWRQEEKRTTEDEMVGWHHRLDGHEFEQALGVAYGQGSLPCCMQSMGSQRVRHDCVTELNWGTRWGPTTSVPLYTWCSMLCFLPVIFPLESDKNGLFCTTERKHIVSYFSGFLVRFKIFKCRGKALEWSSF